MQLSSILVAALASASPIAAYKASFYNDQTCMDVGKVVKSRRGCHNIKPGKYGSFEIQKPSRCNTTFYAASDCVTTLATLTPDTKGTCEALVGSSVASYKVMC